MLDPTEDRVHVIRVGSTGLGGLGGERTSFSEVMAFGIRDAEAPGAPVGAPVGNFSCEARPGMASLASASLP